jgi:hypothetical protein
MLQAAVSQTFRCLLRRYMLSPNLLRTAQHGIYENGMIWLSDFELQCRGHRLNSV